MNSAEAAARASVLLLLRGLENLRGFEPVGALTQKIATAMNGGEGVGPRELARLNKWSHTWMSLDPRLRAFYEHEAGAGGDGLGPLEAGLWKVLEGRAITGRQTGAIKARWRNLYGAPAQMDLHPCPNPFPVDGEL